MSEAMKILGLDLVCTCGACPEQYDAFYEGEYVGYFRLRHGGFTVDDSKDNTILSESTIGDGVFDSTEREDCLTRGCLAILRGMVKAPEAVQKDWKYYVLGLPQDAQLKMLMALLEWQIDGLKGEDVRFFPGEDPDYQGTFTANAEIYWTSCGESLLK